MSNTKFTPGELSSEAIYSALRYAAKNPTSVFGGVDDEGSIPEGFAYRREDADLFAAARDLYEALEWPYSQIGKPEISLFGVKKIQDALAKARGEKTDEQ